MIHNALLSVRKFYEIAISYIKSHKVISVIAAIVIIGIGYWAYGATHNTSTQTSYVLGTVQTGTLISIVSGSGQVSPSDQVTINPKASGTITRVLVTNGQNIAAGQALAYIDSTDEYNALQSAQASLQSAQLALQKLQEPPQQLSVTQSQDSVAKAQESQTTAKTNLAKAYNDGYSDVVSTFVSLPSIMTGLKDIVTGTEASHGSQWNIDYYENATLKWDSSATTYRTNAYNTYTAALASYNQSLADYQLTSANSSTSTTSDIITESYNMSKDVQDALNASNALIQFYEGQVKDFNQTPSPTADSALLNLSAYVTTVNGRTSALLADSNNITGDQLAISDAARTIVENQQSLQQLQAGPNTLDVQSAQLNIQQQQTAVAQAQTNLDNYTIRAPISGALANLALHTGDTVSTGTSVATEITTQSIVTLSLNEIDAAKVAAGQKVTLTFDAIPDLSLAGSVLNVSPLGTVTQGVVSYTVQIGFDTQDPRVKAGMTVNANIQTAVHQNVLTVPASAVKTTGTSSYVQVFNPALANTGGTAGVVSTVLPQNVPVQIGISDNTNTEITSGLTAGEQIVTRTIGGTAAKSTAATATSRSSGLGGGGGGAAGIRL